MVDAARKDGSHVIVDFDHTLFGCNSTELFIATCKPSIIVALIDFVVRRCIPWRLTRLPYWFRIRDYVCCAAIITLCPWNIWRWKRTAPSLFAQSVNSDLAALLQVLEPARISIISFGLTLVIAGLLQGSQWSQTDLVATPMLKPWRSLLRGKLALARRHVGSEKTATALFITDSLDDQDLLLAARDGVLIKPFGQSLRAAEHLYLPLRYTASAKYTASYVLDQFVLVELALLAISVSHSPAELVARLPALALLFLSILCIYEIGYFENDVVAALKEKAPNLKDAAWRFRSYPIQPAAWLWAFATGLPGLALERWLRPQATASISRLLAFWTIGLVLLRLVFYLYNKPDLRRRLHLYPILQILKYLPMLVIVAPTPLGAMLILCQVATMWAVYLTYRHGGRAKDIEREFYRIFLMAVGVATMTTTGTINDASSRFQVLALLVWVSARLAKGPLLNTFNRRRGR